MKISVIVHPNVKKPRVEVDPLGTLHVFVHPPSLEGRANQAVVEALATFLKKRKSSVRLVGGVKSKHKIFDIDSD